MAELYDQQIEAIKALYEPRIIAALNYLREEAIKIGLISSPVFEMADEEFEWMLVVSNDKKELFDVRIVIAEEHIREGGEKEEALGLNFGVSATTPSGRILVNFFPYNYSLEVWVNRTNTEAVEERFQLFNNPEELAYFLLEDEETTTIWKNEAEVS